MLNFVKPAATAFALAALALPAQVAAEPLTPADIAVLAAPCASCHGTDGRSPGPMVSIAGRPEPLLKAQLRAFRSDTPPPGTTVMDRLARGYSLEQLDALAHHFASLPATAPAAGKEPKQ